MKYAFIFLIFVFLGLTGCGNAKQQDHPSEETHEHGDGTHEHEDGSIHENHEGDEHHQEEFKLDGDTTGVKKDTMHGHSHGKDSHQH